MELNVIGAIANNAVRFPTKCSAREFNAGPGPPGRHRLSQRGPRRHQGAEVARRMSGTTKKFKKQKGGGARHGDYRAPIFVGGGARSRRKPRSFAQKVNRKMYRGAISLDPLRTESPGSPEGGRDASASTRRRPRRWSPSSPSSKCRPRAADRHRGCIGVAVPGRAQHSLRACAGREGPESGQPGRRRPCGDDGRSGEEDRGVAGMSNERICRRAARAAHLREDRAPAGIQPVRVRGRPDRHQGRCQSRGGAAVQRQSRIGQHRQHQGQGQVLPLPRRHAATTSARPMCVLPMARPSTCRPRPEPGVDRNGIDHPQADFARPPRHGARVTHGRPAQGRAVRAADRVAVQAPAAATITAASPRVIAAAVTSSITASSISSATRKASPPASSASNTIPNRTAHIALLCYADGERRYIIAPKGVKVGDQLIVGPRCADQGRQLLPLRNIPVGSTMHCIEMKPGKGAQIARSAGASAQLVARESGYATLRLRSGEMRRVPVECRATIGEVGNSRAQPEEARQGRRQALARYSPDRSRRGDEPGRPSARRW